MNAKLCDEIHLFAGGTIERIDVTPVRFVPEIIFHQHLDTNLSLLHTGIIAGMDSRW